MKDTITTLLIVFISLKLMDFNNLGILDYIILFLTIFLLIISILKYFKKGGHSK
nr:MAG TPA: hypothetical protein [Caudoviricetes sp.]